MTYQCKTCRKEFGNRRQLSTHVVAAHRKKPCPKCKKLFSHLAIKRHLRVHERDEKYNQTCEKCKKEMTTKYGSGRFCSSSCAHAFSTHHKLEEINKKRSKTVLDKTAHTVRSVSCLFCGSKIEIRGKKTRKYCSRACHGKFRYNKRNPNYEKNMKASSLAGRAAARKQRRTRRSKNEILFYEMCKKKFPDSLPNEPMFNGWDADVVIPSLKIAVMWNGAWHYRKITEAHSVKQVQNRDRIKVGEIKKMGWKPYVIRDDGSYDPKFVLKEWRKFLGIAE